MFCSDSDRFVWWGDIFLNFYLAVFIMITVVDTYIYPNVLLLHFFVTDLEIKFRK